MFSLAAAVVATHSSSDHMKLWTELGSTIHMYTMYCTTYTASFYENNESGGAHIRR